MDYNTIKLSHTFFTVAFLLSYLIKTILFFSNQDAFRNYKAKTLPVETLAAVAFLVTGFWMLYYRGGFGGMAVWFHIKFTLVLLAVPLGIIGFKKENKLLVLLSTIFFFFILGLALTKDPFLMTPSPI
jgi:uncharacterized membrane protein SirB2